MTNTRTLRTAITLLVIVAIWSTTAIAQNWLRGWKYGAKTVTVPYSVADLEYGKTLKLRIDSERDRIKAEKLTNKMFGPYRLIGDTYYFGTYGTASVLIKTTEGNIIINYPFGGDSAFGDKTVSEATIANLEKAGLQLKDIKYFLSSESHADHNGGVAEIIAKSHGKLITMEGDEKAMENQKDIGFPQPKVSEIIENGYQLKLGGKTLTAYHTKGHTPGATTWMWQETENGVTYNVANVCCWDMPANLVTNPDVSTAELKKTWEILKSLPVDVPMPGHHPWQFGWPAKEARLKAGEDRLSVVVDPEGYRGWVAVYNKLFEDNLAKQLKDGPPKLDGRRGSQPAPPTQ